MLEQFGLKKLYEDNTGPKVVVGLSGGVDSSVTAAILKWQGYQVIGLFMRNWTETDESGACTTEADFADVKAVAEHLEIPYYSINFADKYMDEVFEKFLDGLKRGFTPNPDVLCNRQIKFGHFAKYARTMGDYIATGHFSRIKDGKLLKGLDESKDQSYFLCGLTGDQLENVLFPVGELKKSDVRKIAQVFDLPVAKKKDSTGICFIGERKHREFLQNYIGNKSGKMVTPCGRVVGQHIGLMFYTIGQRKGLGLGGIKGFEDGKGWIVVRKDLDKNELVVCNGECEQLFSNELTASNFNWVAGKAPAKEFKAAAKIRYRQADQPCMVYCSGDNLSVRVVFDTPQRAVTPGQWVVVYDGDVCLGGGEING